MFWQSDINSNIIEYSLNDIGNLHRLHSITDRVDLFRVQRSRDFLYDIEKGVAHYSTSLRMRAIIVLIELMSFLTTAMSSVSFLKSLSSDFSSSTSLVR